MHLGPIRRATNLNEINKLEHRLLIRDQTKVGLKRPSKACKLCNMLRLKRGRFRIDPGLGANLGPIRETRNSNAKQLEVSRYIAIHSRQRKGQRSGQRVDRTMQRVIAYKVPAALTQFARLLDRASML